MNTYEVVNLRGEMKTLHGTSGLDALLRAGLNPRVGDHPRHVGSIKKSEPLEAIPAVRFFNSRTRAELAAKNYTTTRSNFSIRKFTKKVKSF